MIFSERKLIFIHVPKTGGNFFSRSFAQFSDDNIVVNQRYDGVDRFDIQGPITQRKHQSLSEYAEVMGSSIAEYTVVAFARPPLERLLSLYFSPHRWIVAKEDGSYELDVDRKTPFVLEDFRTLIEAQPSTAEMIDADRLDSPTRTGASVRHETGATVRLLDFRHLTERSRTLAIENDLPCDQMPAGKVNQSVRRDWRKTLLSFRPDLRLMIKRSRHAKDVKLCQ